MKFVVVVIVTNDCSIKSIADIASSFLMFYVPHKPHIALCSVLA